MNAKWWLGVLICWSVPVLCSGAPPENAGEEVLVLQPDAEGRQRATIVLDSYAFTPRDISVQAGMPVELHLENRSFLTPHNFVFERPVTESPATGALPDEVNLSAGESTTIRFMIHTPGTYTFYCDKQLLFFPSHREEGMEGRLEVRPESPR